MLLKLKNLFFQEEGQGMVEYGLLLALISIVAIAAITSVGQSVNNIFNNTANIL